MRLYQPTCDDCDAVGPTYSLKAHARRAVTFHECDRACPSCGWRRANRHQRGLCSACYRSDARHDAPLALHRASVLFEDAEWLADDGATLADVLARLDIKKDTFWQACKRGGRMDLYWRLADRMLDADLRRAISRRKTPA